MGLWSTCGHGARSTVSSLSKGRDTFTPSSNLSSQPNLSREAREKGRRRESLTERNEELVGTPDLGERVDQARLAADVPYELLVTRSMSVVEAASVTESSQKLPVILSLCEPGG